MHILIAMIDYAGLNFEMEACGTDVWELWECNGESIQGIAEAESVVQLQAVHLFLFRCLTLRSEYFSFLFTVNCRLKCAHL